MRLASLLCVCLGAYAAAPNSAALELLNKAPLRFESAGERAWIAHGPGFEYRFDGRGIAVRDGSQFMRIEFQGAGKPAFEALAPASSITHYFIGASRTARQDFLRLRQRQVYPGIDVVYYGTGRDLEYDFEIAPGADPSRVALRFPGADRVEVKNDGELLLTAGGRTLGQRAPVVYQRRDGAVDGIESRYWMAEDGTVRIKLGAYDPAEELVIDPVIGFTAYLYGSAMDNAVAVARDAQGFVYVAGNTLSTDFTTAGNAYQTANQGNLDGWFAKLNPLASDPTQVLVYSSYFGGGANDTVHDMTVDAKGVVYLAGTTDSATFPLAKGAFQSSITINNHAFVAVVDPSQDPTSALVYSTYLGGTNFEEALGIAVANGKVYVTGYTTSDDFPVGNAYKTTRTAGYDAFITLLDPTQSGFASLLGSTFFGGSGYDVGRSIAVDKNGIAYVTGSTYSSDLPTTPDAFESFYQGNGDAFLVKMDMVGAQLLSCTYFGSSDIDDAKKIKLDATGRVALAGFTFGVIPTQRTPVQLGFNGNGDAFLAVLDLTKAGSDQLAYLAYYGGTDAEVAYALAIDAKGRYILGGYTLSRDLPVTSDALNPGSDQGGYDGFVAVIDPAAAAGKALAYSSFVTSAGSQIVYGVAADSAGNVFVIGQATANVFPGSAAQHLSGLGNIDAFFLTIKPQ
jgi:hypothetical protein